MQCAQCGFDNPSGMKFCGECGTPLKQVCASCDFESPPNFKFCGNCGVALSAALDTTAVLTRPGSSQTATVVGSDLSTPEAERRQLTVLFCDLVGSTALSQQLDPEELHQVVSAYQAVCVAVINRFEGHVAQYLGDGLLVYFGYPRAHEDDAQRAGRTGLGIIEAIERLSSRLQQDRNLSLTVRIGIHTGLVVVGQIGSGEKHEQLALGDTPNIAARLQGLAEPNTVIISDTTYRLVRGYFTLRDMGSRDLAGLSDPLTIYRLIQEREIQSRLEAKAEDGLTPLVGREQELDLLLARWEQVKENAGQMVSLNGEGGIGKSRLLHGLKERLGDEPHLWLETYCSPYHQNSALYPLITLLQQVLEFERTDSQSQKLGKIEAALARLPHAGRERALSESVPLMATLLSISLNDEYGPVNLPPHRQKQLTLEILLTMLLDTTLQQPVIFVMEDLHWVDPSTLEFINLLIEQGSTARLFVLLTYRPTFSPPWTPRSHLTQLTLSRLTHNQVAAMVERVAGSKALPPTLLTQIITKTDGVPLFVEELTKMVLELNLLEERNGRYELTSPLPMLTIPTTLQDSLMARLDRLATVKEVAQVAATLGREFSYDLLEIVSDLDEKTLRQDLGKLVETELLYQRGMPPYATYIFKHALVQEAAYRSLLRSRRQLYHRKIGQVLTLRFPDIAERQPEVVAHHYTVAGMKEEAIRYWQRAGERAISRSANLEAIDHLTTGLELMESLAATPARTEQRLKMQITLGAPYLMTKGYAALEVEQVYAKAWQICQRLGNTPQLAPALYGLWLFYLVRADYKMATDLGDQLMVSAQWSKNSAFLVEAHQSQGINHFYLGELGAARDHLSEALRLYDPQQRGTQLAYSGANPAVACLAHLAQTLWLLGYPEQAQQKIDEAAALADDLNQPYSQVFAAGFGAWLNQYLRQGAAAQQAAERAISLAEAQGFSLLLHFSRIFRGWSLAEQGQAEAGILQIRTGLDAYLATGAELGRLHFTALLAEAYGQAGQSDAGISLIDEALAGTGDQSERFYEAELYRLKGVLLLQAGGDEVAAEGCFQQAIAVSQEQAARSLELRAATNLARLWLAQGRATDAQTLLASLLAWFEEGFATHDYQTARQLLTHSRDEVG